MIQRRLIYIGMLLFLLLSLLLYINAYYLYNSSFTKYSSFNAFARGYALAPARHFVGAFSVDTPIEAAAAASDGIQYTIHYGAPHSATSPQGLALQKAGIKEYSSRISDFLADYECHKALLTGHTEYCTTEPVSQMTSVTALLNGVKSYLQENQQNSLIAGHWILDDWPKWDYGSAKQILVVIHQLIRQYTPNLPAICGFGAGFGSGGEVDWDAGIAANFSPQACDEIGLYVYASPADTTDNPPTSDAYDWTMSKVLPQIAKSLQAQGWNSRITPWIGIGQAFGGIRASNHTKMNITPSVNNMTAQALSFCKAGAKDILWYAYDQKGYYAPGTERTPMNSPTIKAGIRSGIAACKAWWSSTAQKPS